MIDYIAHFIIGILGMAAGLFGGKFCPHFKHQILVGVLLVAAETIATVRLVG
jgi:hypothetical protein